jgi:sortase A
MTTTRVLRSLGTAALFLATVACGSATDTADTTPSPATTTNPPTTAAEATTTTPDTTPTTTAAPRSTKPPRTTTTLPPLPVPIAPPPPGTVEPEFMLGTIEIPAIGVVRDLYSGITMPTLDKGPGYWPGTALPGELGNTVVAGHRTSKDRPFERLDDLLPGDEIIFTTASGRHVYAVTSTEIVTPDALWIVDQTYDHRATLFACHPPGSVDYRIVVYADLVDSPSVPAET